MHGRTGIHRSLGVIGRIGYADCGDPRRAESNEEQFSLL